MLNQSGIKKTSFSGVNQILFDVDNQKSVSVIVSGSIASTSYQTVDGRKIVKAGTPLSGDLKSRKTAMVAAADGSGTPATGGKPAVGVLLHDVDITDGNANATLLIWGFVNLDRLDATTKALITTSRETELDGKVWFLTDN